MTTTRCLIKPIYKCNGNCIFCVYEDLKESPVLSLEDIIERMDQLEEDNEIETVTLSGGEPAIHPQFFELLKVLRERGYKTIELHTNGMSFSDYRFTQTVKKYVDVIVVSVHASTIKEYKMVSNLSHDSIVKIFEGIRNIGDGFDHIETNTVVVTDNIMNLSDIAKFIKKIRPRKTNISYPVPLGAFKKIYRQHACIIGEDFISKVGSFIRELNPIGCTYQLMPICLMKGLEEYYEEEYDQHVIDFRCKDKPFILSVNPEKNIGDFIPIRKEAKCLECKYTNDCIGFWKCYIENGIYREFW